MGPTRSWFVLCILIVLAACGEVQPTFLDAAVDADPGDGQMACDDRACSDVADSCCPAACNANTDLDCASICGNSTLEPGEVCDPLATCPTQCPAQGCNLFALDQPDTCFAQCQPAGTQAACANGDGCCPPGCNANNDGECPAACGNGVVETGERCDPLSACPASCPQVGCQLRTLQGGGTCGAQCVNGGMQTMCRAAADGCCPSGCNANNDPDCAPGCGNGVIEAGETCDPLNTCPTSCPAVGCQLRTLQGGGTCGARCVNGGMQTACANNDGCCAAGCNANNDNDCAPVCGNGAVESGETCDPNAPAGQNCQCAAEAFTCYRQTGSATQCNVRCHQPTTTCGINGDNCCAFEGGGGCGASNDNECSGDRWQVMQWPEVADYTSTQCWTERIYGIDAFGSYLFTTCQPAGSGAPGGDPVITSVRDNLGNTYDVTNDNCTDPTALPRLAGWRCDNQAGQLRMSCASMNPGGFRPRSGQVNMIEVRVCPFNATTTGRAPFHIWFNARLAPNPG